MSKNTTLSLNKRERNFSPEKNSDIYFNKWLNVSAKFKWKNVPTAMFSDIKSS